MYDRLIVWFSKIPWVVLTGVEFGCGAFTAVALLFGPVVELLRIADAFTVVIFEPADVALESSALVPEVLPTVAFADDDVLFVGGVAVDAPVPDVLPVVAFADEDVAFVRASGTALPAVCAEIGDLIRCSTEVACEDALSCSSDDPTASPSAAAVFRTSKMLLPVCCG